MVDPAASSLYKAYHQLQEIDKDTRKEVLSDLTALWRSSVEATHSFLSRENIDRIETYVPQAIEEVEHLVIAQDVNGVLLGFIGIAEQKVEMLFLCPDVRGQGLGRRLVEYAYERYHVSEVDVNEQNEQARVFYEHLGFAVVSRSETDAAGDPFPVLHMQTTWIC